MFEIFDEKPLLAFPNVVAIDKEPPRWDGEAFLCEVND